MEFNLAINTGFAVNRYPEAEDWCRVIRNAGVRRVQFTADLLNPSLPDWIIEKKTKEIIASCRDNNLKITSTFTGAFTRVNHLAHSDPDIRSYWKEWFKRFADLTVSLGASTMGSHFGIFSMTDDRDPKLRALRRKQNIGAWHEIAEYAKTVGIKQIIWEPMSISREQGETISACKELQSDVNAGAQLPFFLCLDVDHGDISSSNKSDADPYAWLKEFASEAPFIHLKQSSADKGGHWPFTAKYNSVGRIKADKVLDILKKSARDGTELILELSFREREPADRSAPAALKDSVDYWRNFL